MNVTESIHAQNVAAYLRGERDTTVPGIRLKVAVSLHELEVAASKRMGAGQVADVDTWDARLTAKAAS